MAVTASPAQRATGGRATSARPLVRLQPAALLLVALLCVLGYALFAQGAVQLPHETYVQIALAALGLAATVLWLTGEVATPAARRAGWLGVGLIAGFAAWNGLSLLWTVAPEETWLSFNRGVAYAIAAGLALALGSWVPRAVERLAIGWMALAAAAALYALGGKVAPGVHLGTVFTLDHTDVFSRLRSPLGYWNALALMCALALPIALTISTDRTRALRVRQVALAIVSLFIVVGGMTYSRGGVLALAVGVVTLMVLGRARLRTLLVLGLAALAAVAPLAVAFSSSALTSDGVSLGRRTSAGLILGVVILASLAGLLAAGRWAVALESRVRWSPRRSRVAWRSVAVAAGVVLLTGVVALAASARGLGGSISHQVDTFTAVRKDPITDPSRLLSTSSGNRWVWWLEAAGAFSDRPLAGWGAGSFPVVHLLYRKPPPLPVRQPHSVPLQFLAEDGLIGAALGIGGLVALVLAALTRARWAQRNAAAPALRRAAQRGAATSGMPGGRERELSVALVAAGLAWLVHSGVDWDWDIPGVTLPALCFLAVLAAQPARRLTGPGRAWANAPAVMNAGGGLKALVVGAVTLCFCLVALSAVLPAWAHSKALNALASVGPTSSATQLQSAAAQEDLATRLDPLGDEALLDAATIATRRGLQGQERHYMLEAVGREPYDAGAWSDLAGAALAQQDIDGAVRAIRKALTLDPLNPRLRPQARLISLVETPPADSATATGTPLGTASALAPRPTTRRRTTPRPTTRRPTTRRRTTPRPTTRRRTPRPTTRRRTPRRPSSTHPRTTTRPRTPRRPPTKRGR